MSAGSRFDAVVDGNAAHGRADRFLETFWHLAPGRPYVIPGAASEVGRRAGDLGALLRDASSAPDEPLRSRSRRTRSQQILIALKTHVRHQVVGDLLVLEHDLPDVLAKIREEDGDAFLGSGGMTRHRVLEVVPAEEPPPPPTFREGPEPRDPPTDRPISRAPLSLRDYRDVVVAPLQLVIDGRVLLPDSYRHHQAPLPTHKALAEVGPRFAVPKRPIGPDLPRLEGTFLHLDDEARGHFGHLMTETLSRTWAWERALEIDPDVRAIMGATRRRPTIAEWEYDFYAACGIPRDRIVLLALGSPVRVERLISGTAMWAQPQFVHPAIRDTWRRVGETLAATASPRNDWPRRIFASRRIAKRGCVNGDQLEAEFRDAGFDVVFPEDFSLGDQVALFRNAEVIAGYAGSGMFQTLFVPEPTHVIQVASEAYFPRNEYLIAATLGHRLESVVCRAEPFGGKKQMHAPFRYDPDREGPFLRELLADLPPPGR
jgi:capsular polysaccharide biosynthesis protein